MDAQRHKDVDVEDVLAQAMCLFASFSGRQYNNTLKIKQYLLSKPHGDFQFLLFVLENQI